MMNAVLREYSAHRENSHLLALILIEFAGERLLDKNESFSWAFPYSFLPHNDADSQIVRAESGRKPGLTAAAS